MSDPESILENIADEFIACLRAGGSPSIERYTQQHPTLSQDIFEMLSAIELMEQLSRCESDFREAANAQLAPPPEIEKLGEFDIVREIGRGGMGVVYEGVDRTLQRRVALKVLNDSALTAQKHVDRFRRESRLAAQLHHTNIVSVFGVGEEDQRHFYAMQYVEGVSVQDIVEGLRRLHNASCELDSGEWSTNEGLAVAAALRSGEFAEPRNTHVDVKPSSAVIARESSRAEFTSKPSSGYAQTMELSDSSSTDRERPSSSAGEQSCSDNHLVSNSAYDREKFFGERYWRSVARIGIQVADALHYAHVNGILHRDIKPANLLFDSNGTVWVADFGLAKLSETDDLTQTGDIVGTLKYMAPEQLAGNADARTDVYALGLTLYELLTLRPVHDGENYKDLFAQKQNAAHTSPRKIIPSIPRDLETIVEKSLELDADKRYSSAREILEDLQRFLDDHPIHARRITVGERGWRWCRRNRTLAAMGAMIAGLFLLLPIILGWAYLREAAQKEKTEKTMNVVLEGFDDMFRSYLENDLTTITTLASSSGGETANLAPAMLTKDTAAVMEKMLVVYDRLAAQNLSTTDITLAVESAKARRRVGDLYRKLGRFAKATEAYDDAIERYTALMRRDSSYQLEVARIHQAIGAIHEQRERPELARAEYTAALQSLAGTAKREDSQFELARTHYLLGKQPPIEGATRRRPDARLDGFGQHRPSHVESSIFDGDDKERLAHLETAIDLLTDLRAIDADHAEYRFLLALCLRETDRSETRAKTRVAGSATDLLRELVARFPAVERYRFELCETYRSFKGLSQDVNSQERLKELYQARELAEQLVEEQRDAAAYRISLAHIYAFLGVEYGKQANTRKAEEFTRLAMATHASVVNDFPGLAPLSDRLSKNDKLRLGSWLSQLRRYEEVVELLEPLGDHVYEQLQNPPANNGDLAEASSSTLRECRKMLLPAYEALGDDVGYLVALTWLDEAERAPRRDPRRGPGQGPRQGPPDQGPPGLGPRNDGPESDGRGFPWRGGPPPNHDPTDMALSYDINGDNRITREELPPRMAQEWFSRADANHDGEVDRRELRDLLHTH